MTTLQAASVFLVPIGFPIALCLIHSRRLQRRRVRELRSIASQYSGTFLSGEPPREEAFERSGREVSVHRNPAHEVAWSRQGVTHRLSADGNRVELFATVSAAITGGLKVSSRSGCGEMPGMITLDAGKVGLPHAFHAGYSGSPEHARFFTNRVRRNLDLISRLDYSPGCVLEIGDGRIVLTKHAGLYEGRTLRYFLNLAFPIIDQELAVFVERGVEFIEQVASARGECQICGADLEGDLVTCAKCATRRHRDCWEYTGVCSTYGCGERRAAGV